MSQKRLTNTALLEYQQRLKKLHSVWEAHPGQTKIFRDIFNGGKKRIFIQAGRKWGKTEAIVYLAWRYAVLKNNSFCYVIGPTRKQQKEILWATRRLQGFGPDFGQEVFEGDLRVVFPWNSFIRIDGSEAFEAYRGTTYDLMIMDEYKDCDPRFYDASFPNLLSKNGTLVIIGTPPDREEHYMKLRDLAVADDDWGFYHATSWENPTIPGGREWLTKEKKKYYARGEGSIWEREYEAKFVPGGANSVFPMFQKKVHVKSHDVLEAEIKRDKKNLQWFTVSDPGTSTVFCVLFIAYNPYTSQIYVMDEIYETDREQTSSRNIWDHVARKKFDLCKEIDRRDWSDVYDEAAAWFQNEIATYYGDGLIPTQKGKANKDNQISLLKDILLSEGIMNISDRCTSTIWEIGNYVTETTSSGVINYIKKDDHAIDCLRYFLQVSGYAFDTSVIKKEHRSNKRFYTPADDIYIAKQEKPLGEALDLEDGYINVEDEWLM